MSELTPLQKALLALREMRSKLESAERVQSEPIAIIGMGCRLPGGANDPEAYWQLLQAGVDAIREVPGDRWDVDAYFDPNPDAPGKMYTKWGGFLEEVDKFDPAFFGISPREAVSMDPQQRLLLEVTHEALENAGQPVDRLTGSLTGVFVGLVWGDYGHMTLADPTRYDVYTGTGTSGNVAAGRISYLLDFKGPCLTLDTACSSSLASIHLACQSLRHKECNLAVAGGANLILSPKNSVYISRMRMTAPDGRCKAFDAAADGFVRGEGCGMVVLKRLSDALADGDNILAVIRGSSINQDGSTNGLTAPSAISQQAVIRQAIESAHVSPEQIGYVEAHGTGTSLGDPIEMEALREVIGGPRPDGSACYVGSVKTNIGHLEGAAGVAGLMKLVLCLKNKAIPGNLNFNTLNPNISLDGTPFAIPTKLTAWESTGPRLGAVSSFGWSGTNVHMVVEEAPAQEPVSAVDDRVHVLPLSAKNPEALKALAASYVDLLTKQAPVLQDVCYTASQRRTHHEYRLSVAGRSREDLVESLSAYVKDEPRTGMASGRKGSARKRKLAFVLCGQGPQWHAMGRELLESDATFRQVIEACDEQLKKLGGWSLLEELGKDEGTSRLHETAIAQPALFAVQIGLAAVWKSWGIEPDAVVGHSVGEVGAAYLAGILSLEEALRVIYHRGRVMQQATGLGKMAAVELSAERAAEALKGYEGRVTIGAINSPASVTLSGDADALQAVVDGLNAEGVTTRMLPVNYAFHSHTLDPYKDELVQALQSLAPRPAQRPMISTVTGKLAQPGDYDAAYWGRQIREPVRFSSAIEGLIGEGYDLFIELGPHPVLVKSVAECLQHAGKEGTTLASLRRKQPELLNLLGAFGTLYAEGYPLDWGKLYPAGNIVALPTYPWQRARFWFEAGRELSLRIPRNPDGHPLLGQHMKLAHATGTHVREVVIDLDSLGYLADHRVQGTIVFPGAAYLEMALAAAEEAFGPGDHAVESVSFKKALFLNEAEPKTLQLFIAPDTLGTAAFQIASQQGEGSEQSDWVVHVTGTLRLKAGASTGEMLELDPIKARCPQVHSKEDHYRSAKERGLEYGPTFQGVESLWRNDGEVLGRLRLEAVNTDRYRIHPALLDACFQLSIAALPQDGTEQDTYLPIEVERLRLFAQPGTALWGHGVLREGNDDVRTLDMRLLDDEGRVVGEALGLKLQRIDSAGSRLPDQVSEWLYELQWQSQELALPAANPGSWLVFDDGLGVGSELTAMIREQGGQVITVEPGPSFQLLAPGRYRMDPASIEQVTELFQQAFGDSMPTGIAHLWSLGIAAEPTLESFSEAARLGTGSVLCLVRSLVQRGRNVPRLYLITRGVTGSGQSVAQSPLWGMGRGLSLEHPEFRCKLIDLQAGSEVLPLFRELCADDPEDQISLRGNDRFVARLAKVAFEQPEASDGRLVVPANKPFKLEIGKLGSLDNLTLKEAGRPAPGKGQVEIQVQAAGLNFREVMFALGVYPGGPIQLGLECAGRIVRVGEGVEGLEVGDEVVAISVASFGSFTIADARLVVRKPASMTFEEAATIPVTFLTAYYALHHLGRMKKGDRVLIHAAAGGVGMAAVQLAQLCGAEVFATVGSPEKRAVLEAMGVKHILSSRSLDFADGVLEATNGEGVDLVLNSLAGEFIPKSLSLLRPLGRFLEIGKTDIYANNQLGMGFFRQNISYFAIDLDYHIFHQPEEMQTWFRTLIQEFEQGRLEPLPQHVFPIQEATAAFRFMQQRKNIGKIVLTMAGIETSSSLDDVLVRSDAAYLVTGGLGGLGLEVAKWLTKQGARHLALMGRSAPSEATEAVLEAMRQDGVQVRILRADVSDHEQVRVALSDAASQMPPLRGIIHAAGSLDDGMLMQMRHEQFAKVAAPKIQGAWNLHVLTEQPLDFFVLFSSMAGLLGNAGQANYAAANAFLDALAHYRRSLGKPALSLDWGPWSEVGMAAASANRGKRLASKGVGSISPDKGLQAMELLLGRPSPAQVAVLPIRWDRYANQHPSQILADYRTVASEAREAEAGQTSIREAFRLAPAEEREALIEAYLQQLVARILMTQAGKLDVSLTLMELGIDSLLAVELIDQIESDFGVELAIAQLLQGQGLLEVVQKVLAPLCEPTAVS